jgi:hypothetical protein
MKYIENIENTTETIYALKIEISLYNNINDYKILKAVKENVKKMGCKLESIHFDERYPKYSYIEVDTNNYIGNYGYGEMININSYKYKTDNSNLLMVKNDEYLLVHKICNIDTDRIVSIRIKCCSEKYFNDNYKDRISKEKSGLEPIIIIESQVRLPYQAYKATDLMPEILLLDNDNISLDINYNGNKYSLSKNDYLVIFKSNNTDMNIPEFIIEVMSEDAFFKFQNYEY